MTDKEQGFGLPELLISLLLASFIILALVNQYVGAKRHDRFTQYAIEQALELQLVTDLMRDSIRRAGFTPCLNINHLITIDRRNGHKNLQAIEIKHAQQDSIHIQRMDEAFDLMIHINNPTEFMIRKSMFKSSQVVLISDCMHAEIHQIKAVKSHQNGQRITLSEPLLFNYQKPIFVGEWLQERFYIHPKKGEAALFYRLNRADELASFIKSMRVHLKQSGRYLVLAVILGLSHGQEIQFETSVRS
ncbi:hypothetical protein [Legionella nagasakiensis]|uniref:hypothetical protein n=1 Tax=Legionella nagasakiensis TaxID=535290 RepID=UPI00105558F4|nr:hypothetical protein [Legionella nagasakiensis]